MAGERERKQARGQSERSRKHKGILEKRRGGFFAKNVKEYQLQSDDDDATTELGGDCSTVCAGI